MANWNCDICGTGFECGNEMYDLHEGLCDGCWHSAVEGQAAETDDAICSHCGVNANAGSGCECADIDWDLRYEDSAPAELRCSECNTPAAERDLYRGVCSVCEEERESGCSLASQFNTATPAELCPRCGGCEHCVCDQSSVSVPLDLSVEEEIPF